MSSQTSTLILDHLPYSVALIDGQGNVVQANRVMGQLLGVSQYELLGSPLPLDFIESDDRHKVDRSFQDARTDGRSQSTFRYISGDGIHGMASLIVKLVADADASAVLPSLLVSILDRTDLGYAEANLIQSESLYRSFLEQSPMGVLHLDAVGNVTFENQQFRRIIGDDPRFTWIATNLETAPGFDRRLAPFLKALLSDGQPFANQPFSIILPDDSVAELAAFGSPIRQSGGEIVGGVILLQDRTRQLEQERELSIRDRFREAESTLRGSAIVGTEEDEYLDDAARILGAAVGADELLILAYNIHDRTCSIGARWLRDTSAADTAAGIRVKLKGEADSDGMMHIDEDSLRSLLGAKEESDEVLWMPFYSAGDLGGFVAFRLSLHKPTLPIPRQQQLHLFDTLIRTFETLWESVQIGARYRLAVSTIDDGLFTYQLDEFHHRRYTFVTPQFKHLLGVSMERILATDLPTTWFESGIDESGKEKLSTHYDELNAERPSITTYAYTQPNGKVCWLREDSTPHRGPGGTLTVSGMLSDITDRRAAEQVLVRSKEDAIADARRKTSFLSTMSHELRTPLGTVNGFASMLHHELADLRERASIPAELIDFSEAIAIRSRELLDFVDDLLDLSNLESGLLRLQNGLVDVSSVVTKTIDSVQADLDRSMIVLSVDIQDDLFASGDEQRLERVVRKVLQNAVKFTDTGGSVRISASGNGDFVRIEISDTGVGIDPAQLGRVVNPFEQADDRLNRRYEGKGIGLTVAKRLIEAMSGGFEIASQVGLGTSVILTIPEGVREKL